MGENGAGHRATWVYARILPTLYFCKIRAVIIFDDASFLSRLTFMIALTFSKFRHTLKHKQVTLTHVSLCCRYVLLYLDLKEEINM